MGNLDEHLSPPPGCLRAKMLQREALAPAAKEAHPIRVNPFESVSHFYQFSNPGPEQSCGRPVNTLCEQSGPY
jgi:hypothetical protein